MSYNKIIVIGNLTRDPEKRLVGETSLLKFGIASSHKYSVRGESREEVLYANVDVWGRQAEALHQYLSKGKPVLVEGRLKMEEWDDRDGNKRTTAVIVADNVRFLPRSSDSTPAPNRDAERQQGPGDGGFPQGETFNDEVPF